MKMFRTVSVFALALGLFMGFGSAQAHASCIIGKVYLDANGNQVQDTGEKGVADVRLFTSSGLLIISDQEGRYSYCGRDSRTMVVKLDASSVAKICVERGLVKASAGSKIVKSDDPAVGRDFFSEPDGSQMGGGLGRADFGLRCQ